MKEWPIDGEVTGLFVGKVAPLANGTGMSAISKVAQSGPAWITFLGIEGDEQADPEVHGGLEQALHHYPIEHGAFWAAHYRASEDEFAAGSFGENISSRGLTEQNLCIGDVLTFGSVTVQVSQGRQPCWKLDAHTGRSDLAHQFRKTGRTGWYYRVLEEGAVEVGTPISLVNRPCPDWTIARVTLARFNPKLDPRTAAILAELRQLSPTWRKAFAEQALRVGQ